MKSLFALVIVCLVGSPAIADSKTCLWDELQQTTAVGKPWFINNELITLNDAADPGPYEKFGLPTKIDPQKSSTVGIETRGMLDGVKISGYAHQELGHEVLVPVGNCMFQRYRHTGRWYWVSKSKDSALLLDETHLMYTTGQPVRVRYALLSATAQTGKADYATFESLIDCAYPGFYREQVGTTYDKDGNFVDFLGSKPEWHIADKRLIDAVCRTPHDQIFTTKLKPTKGLLKQALQEFRKTKSKR